MRASLIAAWTLGACAPADDVASETPFEVVFAPQRADGDSVVDVDLDRYLGTWFEIATWPIPWQAACTATTATYGLREDGDLSVFNRCRLDEIDGAPFSFLGRATPVDDTNARLLVSFFSAEGGAPYWVIERDDRDVDEPYRWAVVSDPTDSTLWILHRHPQMDDALLAPLLARIAARGLDVDRLVYTEQPAAFFDPVAEAAEESVIAPLE